MEGNTHSEELSDYDAEWELEGDDSPESAEDAEFDQQTDEGESVAPESAPAAAQTATSDKSTDSPAEGESEEDIWANATEAQREAFRRAENERLAAANRAKIHADKLADRGRELKSLRDEYLELKKATVTPTEFEQEHEVYAKNIDEMIERRLAAALPSAQPTEEKTAAEIEQEVFETITSAHPDAGEVYNSPELQALLADDPVFKDASGQPVLFSESLHSDDPQRVVEALNYFKSHTTSTDGTDKGESALESMQTAESRTGPTDMRTKGQLTPREQYDAEWELDD